MYVPGEAEYATAWTGPLIHAEVSRRNMGRRRKEKREKGATAKEDESRSGRRHTGS